MTSGSSAERKTLVLVHGAWHGSWCWERLLPQHRIGRGARGAVRAPLRWHGDLARRLAFLSQPAALAQVLAQELARDTTSR